MNTVETQYDNHFRFVLCPLCAQEHDGPTPTYLICRHADFRCVHRGPQFMRWYTTLRSEV